eukprot:3030724-Prorocentrum_lima.AAC.1
MVSLRVVLGGGTPSAEKAGQRAVLASAHMVTRVSPACAAAAGAVMAAPGAVCCALLRRCGCGAGGGTSRSPVPTTWGTQEQ